MLAYCFIHSQLHFHLSRPQLLAHEQFLWIARMIKVPRLKFPPSGAAKAILRANADQEMNEQTKGALAA
jgi:hypothetical protein